jgi:hypothetical protein
MGVDKVVCVTVDAPAAVAELAGRPTLQHKRVRARVGMGRSRCRGVGACMWADVCDNDWVAVGRAV